MLEQLVIKDFAVARSVVIRPGPGLNVFTGETGSGKSLIVDAVAFAFGAKRGREVIAGGADRATVEATVVIDGARHVMERTLTAAGRSSSRIDGEPATIEMLLAHGNRALDIHGQSDQLAILKPAAQLEALDAYAGLAASRAELAAAVRELRAARRNLREISADGPERERLLDQLRFEADEIAAAALQPGEDGDLQGERTRLGDIARLTEDAHRALAALENAALAEAASAIASIAGRDPSAAGLAASVDALETAAHELNRELRNYLETLEEDPARLAAVEERLDRIARLKRKYGATVEEVLAYGATVTAKLDALASSGEQAAELRARESALCESLGRMAEALSRNRRAATAPLREALGAELEHLGMGGAALEVAFGCEDDAAGLPVDLPDYETASAETPVTGERHRRAFTESGVDRLEFLASFNAGEQARALGSVASGGETSRFLLALTAVLGSAGEARVVVFDEVDEGVGGRAGSLVGAALSRLAQRHQVLCVTHLPQVAAFGAHHFVVVKEARDGDTWSQVRAVEGDERIAELAAMLGGAGEGAIAAAMELFAAAIAAAPA